MRNQNISQSNQASRKSHLVLRRFVILWPSWCSSDSTKHPYAFTTSVNLELLSPVTFNEVVDISSSIWKRIKLLLVSLILSLYRDSIKELWPSMKKKLVSVTVVFSVVHALLLKSGSQSKHCIWQKRGVSKQKHKCVKPFGGTWAFKDYFLYFCHCYLLLKL